MKLKTLPILTALFFTAFVSCKDEQASAPDVPDKVAEAKSEYPIDTCVVSGEKLGSMGEPFVITHEGTEVRFCCDACLPKFNEDPSKYLAKLKK